VKLEMEKSLAAGGCRLLIWITITITIVRLAVC
jgi:hypothetical protein